MICPFQKRIFYLMFLCGFSFQNSLRRLARRGRRRWRWRNAGSNPPLPEEAGKSQFNGIWCINVCDFFWCEFQGRRIWQSYFSSRALAVDAALAAVRSETHTQINALKVPRTINRNLRLIFLCAHAHAGTVEGSSPPSTWTS